MQLFSVHVIIKSGNCMKQIPVAFVLMSRRRKKDYIKVFKKLLDLVPSPQVEKVMLDFEAAMWSALRELMANGTLPKVDLRGCLFHFTQAVFRRIIIIGLKDQYWKDAGTRYLCKQCMSLPLIPTEHVPLVFPELKRRLLASEVTLLHQLVPYTENTWINGMWNPSNWGQFDQAIRTNNDVEGFHNKMNHICQKPNVEFSTLVKELHKEAGFIHTTAVRVFTGETTRKRKPAQVARQDKLNSLWDQLRNKKIDGLRVVEKAAGMIAAQEYWEAEEESRADLDDDDQ